MISPLSFAAGTAALTIGLFVEAWIFSAMHSDLPSTYRLFAVRDKLMRLVIDGKLDRHEPHLDALYKNMNILLKGSRHLGGPDGWQRAEAVGIHLARRPCGLAKMVDVPKDPAPPELEEVSNELSAALEHLLRNHWGIAVVLGERRRELERIQRERARLLLQMMQRSHNFRADGAYVV